MKVSSRISPVRRLPRPDRLALLLLLAWLVAPALRAELGHGLTPLPEPLPAPGFSLEDMDGNVHSLADQNGKVVMVNFWATWCPPCREEMPSMEALYQSLREEDFTVMAVNQWESPDQAFLFLGQLAFDPAFPILFDRDSTVAEAYGVKGLPTTVLIDRAGRVRYRAVGGRNFDHPEVRDLIRELLEEPAASP